MLLDGDRIAGLLQIVAHGRSGELRVLGRAPAYRGAGLGPRLVAEGLRLLRAAGVGDVSLMVEALNEDALALYRRFDFLVVERVPTFALALR
jgi:ribosomal protein S18 acetylase RimI-like enzyme